MQSIRTRYLPATLTKPARIRAQACGGASLTLSVPIEMTSEEAHDSARLHLMGQLGWQGAMISGEFQGDQYWVFCPYITSEE